MREALRDGKAEAGAFDGALFSAQPLERLKEERQLVRRNACAAVSHADSNPIAFSTRARDGDGSVIAVVLHRVTKKVQQDLFQPLPIRANVAAGGSCGIDAHGEAAGFGERPNQVSALLHDFGSLDRLG